jgi:membrane protein
VKLVQHPLIATIMNVYRHFQRGAISTLAAAVAYHTLFAFVPLLLFLTAMVGVVSRVIGIDSVMSNLTDWLYHRSGLPPAAAETLRAPIESIVSTSSGTALGAGALLALYGAQNGVRAMMRALNVAYDVEEGRNWFIKTATATALTVSIAIGIVLVAILVLAGGNLGKTIADWLHLSREFRGFWGTFRWIFAPIMIAAGLAVLYWAGPNRKARIAWFTPGAIIAVLLFTIATWGLGIYFQYAGRYVTAYGVLGGVMAFVFWLYVMAVIALLGACINAVLDRQRGIVSEPRIAPKSGAAWVGVPLPTNDPGTIWAEEPASTPAQPAIPPAAPDRSRRVAGASSPIDRVGSTRA